jgi:tetratricopeptide (TPR) repeat protein
VTSSVSHYCQKCLAANPLGQDFCARCGTRLMIVVEPNSARFEIGNHGLSTDEHLLERISLVENRLSRLTERLERSLDLVLRQAQNSYFDRSLVKTLIGLLTEDGLIETARLERLWSDRCEKDAVEQQENIKRDEFRLRILESPPASNAKRFSDLVTEGFVLIEDGKAVAGIDRLQQAAQINESNSVLDLFIGEYFFRNGDIQIARTYLSRAHNAAPDDVRISLLLGLTCADDGDSQTAKELLASAIERGGSCFSGHYGLGWLHMSENKWRKALCEFKRALEARPSPEAHFALGSLYFKLDRDELAGRHLRKATQMDANYQEAFYLLALIYERTGQTELAEAAFGRAGIRASSRGKTRKSLDKAARKSPPLSSNAKSPADGLITGADRRLAAALREDALRAFLGINGEGR